MLKMDITNEQGQTFKDVLIYVNNTNIDKTRASMKGDVWYMLAKGEKEFYPPFNIEEFANVPYDATLDVNPSKQFYAYLKTQAKFSSAVDA
jgi:hypothetical protein